MFDKSDNQDSPTGDFSNVSLPGSDSASAQQQDQPYQLPDNSDDENSNEENHVEVKEDKTPSGPIDPQELMKIKEEALSKLAPLVSQLDQSPEEKFRTTMMMIQASDDQALLPQAYDAAQAIHDEKGRAQALLDVVNEINYFSQKNQHQ